MANGPRFLLIVSDFHLSEGWDEKTKHLYRQEDFFFDTSFQRFLSTQAKAAQQGGYNIRLIFAGDLVDFQQVITVPGDVDGRPVEPRYRNLGLGTSPAHTCWKLERIITGHRVFFKALADFLAQGHDLVILSGNHDVEWIIREVREKFLKRVADLGPAWAKQKIREQIHFQHWFYLEPGCIYVEHGNQYDPVDAFDYFLHPYLEDGRIDLPAGAFFVRYLFNHAEFTWPFADNMKPSSAFIGWALKRMEGWRNLPRYIQFFRKTLQKAGPLSPAWQKELEGIHDDCLLELSKETELDPDDLRKLKALWVKSALHHLSKWHLFWAFLCRAKEDAPLGKAADEIRRLLGVRYVVFGHTHEADLQLLHDGPPRVEYVNSGTWTKVFAARLEERLLKEENEFVYVRVDRKQPRMELLRWREDRDEGERVRLFE